MADRMALLMDLVRFIGLAELAKKRKHPAIKTATA
jgi:hypothetical protein